MADSTAVPKRLVHAPSPAITSLSLATEVDAGTESEGLRAEGVVLRPEDGGGASCETVLEMTPAPPLTPTGVAVAEDSGIVAHGRRERMGGSAGDAAFSTGELGSGQDSQTIAGST